MDIWYKAHYLADTLPPEFDGYSLGEIEKSLGLGAPARNGRVFTTTTRNVQRIVRQDGMYTTTEYITPVGTVTSTRRRTADLDRQGIGALEVEKLIKRPEDFETVMHIVENTYYHPCYEEYSWYDDSIGDDGLPMVAVTDSPFHDFLANLSGYESAFVQLFDDAPRVERLLTTIEQCNKERMWPVVANSPARLVVHGRHFATQMTPATMYDQYITPYMREFTDLMHENDIFVGQHADNDSLGILDQLTESGYDLQECFVTAPMVPCTLRDARERWGTSMVIWGGVPSVILEEDFPESEFEAFMDDLFRSIAPGDAFILGVADNVMPTSMLSRIRRITEMVEEQGTYPIRG
jgi:hypothetical protein